MNIICFCHLRWNFVYQRPQHLLGRFAKQFNVYVIEEPLFDSHLPHLEVNLSKENVWILVPHLPGSLPPGDVNQVQQDLILRYFTEKKLDGYIAWYYTPMALPIADALPEPLLVVYDCMDELSAFKNAPAKLKEYEAALFEKADLVFTGGVSLYEAKQGLHPAVYPFPSSIDRAHFSKAHLISDAETEQSVLTHPRIGFFGVIDERLDIHLLDELAKKKPGWQFIIIGPVVKIDPGELPASPNIHYLGSKSYDELPSYLSGWDVALIPFALNESTRFISPTKTPEYLAGGIPVVSTPIRDVVKPYGENELVYIGSNADEFIQGIEWALHIRDQPAWKDKVDNFLSAISWDITAGKMIQLINEKLASKQKGSSTQKENEHV